MTPHRTPLRSCLAILALTLAVNANAAIFIGVDGFSDPTVTPGYDPATTLAGEASYRFDVFSDFAPSNDTALDTLRLEFAKSVFAAAPVVTGLATPGSDWTFSILDLAGAWSVSMAAGTFVGNGESLTLTVQYSLLAPPAAAAWPTGPWSQRYVANTQTNRTIIDNTILAAPEPGVALLAALGLAGLGVRGRRRRRP